jgi:hypothetical protein
MNDFPFLPPVAERSGSGGGETSFRRREFSLAEVQRLSRRTFSPTITIFSKNERQWKGLEMGRPRWHWLLFPVGFGIANEAITWTLWVPLSRSTINAQNVHYWEGQVFAFAAIRLLSVVLLSLSWIAFAPPALRWQTFTIGAVTGVVTSFVDRFCWDWVNNHAGYLVALFGIPLVSSSVLILLFRDIDRRLAPNPRSPY